MSIAMIKQSAASVPTPPAGEETIFMDSADDKFKKKIDTGAVIDLEGNAAGVSSFNTRTGNVVSANGDYTASQVTNVPFGTVTATTVQAAINQLESISTGGMTELTGEVLAGPGGGSQPAVVTNAAVIAKVLTGLTETYGLVEATDSILQAIAKLVWTQSLQSQTINQNLTVPDGYTLIRGYTWVTGASALTVSGNGILKII